MQFSRQLSLFNISLPIAFLRYQILQNLVNPRVVYYVLPATDAYECGYGGCLIKLELGLFVKVVVVVVVVVAVAGLTLSCLSLCWIY